MAEAAAKEPTMEDILSSIRQIIAEEGDLPADIAASAPAQEPTPEPAVEPASVVETPDPAPVANSLAQIAAGLQSSEEVSEQSFEVTAEAEVPEMNNAAQYEDMTGATTGSRSLADIAAAVKAMEAPEVVEEPPVPETMQAQPEYEVAPEPMVEESVQYEETLQAAMGGEPDPVVAPAPEAPVAVEPTFVEMAEAIAAPVAATAAVAGTVEGGVEEAKFKGALMSPGSNGAVADSFDRLKRSMMDDLDAKTEAILRPMLREWLDENLPNMVERLVREEIERVARG